MYLKAVSFLAGMLATMLAVSSCSLSSEADHSPDAFHRHYSDQEWLAMAARPEHQPRIVWKGNSIDRIDQSGYSMSLEGLLFHDTPARVLEYQLSKGLLSQRPGLFLPLLESPDTAVVLTGIYIYRHPAHADREDTAAIRTTLRQMLGHPDTRVRCAAVETLERHGWLSVDDVRRALADDAIIVRNMTASFLDRVVGNELADTPSQPADREAAAAVRERLAAVLLDHLNDTYFFVRAKCATTFLNMFPPSDRPAWFAWDKADWHSRAQMQQQWQTWWDERGRTALHAAASPRGPTSGSTASDAR